MKTIILIALTFFICSCGRNSTNPQINTGTIKVIDLFSEPESEIKNLSDIATDLEYIPLETFKNSLIRYIYDIRTVDSKIYIFTLRQVLCFDNNGKYFYKLDKQGRGPEEYTAIYDWDISPENNLLVILIPRKIFIYNITKEGFVFLNSLNFEYQPSQVSFVPYQNTILLSYSSSTGNELFRNILINTKGDTLDVRPNYYKYTKIGNVMKILFYDNINFKNNSTLLFKEFFSDTIFTIDLSSKIIPYLILYSQGKIPTTQLLANAGSFEKHSSEYIQFVNILEVKKYLMYRFYYKSSEYFTVYDKLLKGKFEIDTKTFLKDDITGGVYFEPKFCSDGKLYSWVDAMDLKKYLSGDIFKNSVVKNPEKKKALEKLAASLNETDNPLLIMVTPKK